MMRFWLASTLVVLTAGLPAEAADKIDLPLVFEDSFEKGADHWQPTDPNAWRVAEADGQKVFEQFRGSKYNPPHRSPYNMALVKDVAVGDFVLSVKAKSTAPHQGAHQDMCLFWGYQDPAHFYYVHLGRKADPNSCQIMIVNAAPRKPITKKEIKGIPWDKDWHQVKVVRRVQTGAMEVYFDDMEEPALTAEDKTFMWGQVGLGSFDDTGMWDDFKLHGVRVEKKTN